MAASLDVGLLGPVELRADGSVVPLPRTQRLLLARLALPPGRVVPVAELVDLLWADDPPSGAAQNLHSYVSRLRRVVGRGRIPHEGGGYRLHARPDDVDVGRVERCVAAARLEAERRPAAAVALLADALGTWRGEPLSDLADHLAFAPDVARLVEWRAHLVAEWLELRLGTGPAAEVLPDLERAVREDPSRERLHLLLMRGLHRDGRTAEALRVADDHRRRLAEESGLDPGPQLVELRQRILAGDPGLSTDPAPPRTDPPVRPRFGPRDRFVGRRAELDRLRAATAGPGLVTVVGPGGVGKTRLVQELLDRDDDGRPAFLAPLGDLSAPADLVTAVAAALGLRAAPQGAATAVADRLAADPAVLVLDTCEHLLTAAGRLATRLLDSCPRLCVVATSRQRLGVPGERVVRVAPLAPAERVELFCDRAAALRDGFVASDRVRGVVAEVCGLVDGLPLGVELAARREAVLGVHQLRELLAAGLHVLDPARDADRSTALGATVEWSYRLLEPEARTLLDRLAVCSGGFGPDAVPHLAPQDGGNPVALLAELVESSTVAADLAVDPPRYRLLDTVRSVALGHLGRDGTAEARAAHGRWMQAHARVVHGWQCERSPHATALLRRESANLRDALARYAEAGNWLDAGRLAVPVALAVSDDPSLDLLARLRRLEAVPVDGEAGALCRTAAGAAAWSQGDAVPAEDLLTAAVEGLAGGHPWQWAARFFRLMDRMYPGHRAGVAEDTAELLARDEAPEWVRATAVCCTALVESFSGDRAAAERWTSRHEDLLTRVGAVDGFVDCTRAELMAPDDPEGALARFERAHRLCAERGHTYNREVAGVGRAAVLVRLGRHAEALAACRRSILDLRALGMWPQLWTVLRLTAELLVALDDPGPAAAVLDAADADPLAPAVLGPDRERLAELRNRLADADADADAADAADVDGVAAVRRPVGGRAAVVAGVLAALARAADQRPVSAR
ncbi:winged helix-turn-helix domain-containing protein [Geodermatophilus sp. YIM 151500]|uniref:ATP-binding protein n=1 Tax=Geodermatophilus sp. YIM 151500 TaxID=2984531 RepID=UPI0021E3BC34|nr:BTAD domain-containing putative transcriptional regulator [Geodermatophilus sp. YIM 151500]MCV2490941.1 winged helix-turn-helix domain-containing protein [Geodermatophilus sp. YIM 151500]